MKRHEGREYTVLQGDVREALASLPEQSVHCCVTSPPYWQLRSYLPSDHPDKPRELGQEKLHDCQGWATGKRCGECFVCHMVDVFRGVKRVLRDDGTCWVNMGDSYAATDKNRTPEQVTRNSTLAGRKQTEGGVLVQASKVAPGLKPKDLCGIPWRVALALQADGWTLRQEVIWGKKSPMPESVRDRFTKAHEHIFLLSKSPNYYWDQEAIKEPAATADPSNPGYRENGKSGGRIKLVAVPPGSPSHSETLNTRESSDGTRNPRSVWWLATEPYPGAHFATFPSEIPRRAIQAGTSERGCCPHCGAGWVRQVEREKLTRPRPNELTKRTGEAGTGNHCANTVAGVATRTAGWRQGCDCPKAEPVPATVLDPFGGAGTTGVVALEHGRRAVLCELNPEYVAEHIVPRMDAVEARYGLFAG